MIQSERNKMTACVFIDRDGTIVELAKGFLNEPEHAKLRDGVASGLCKLKNAGFALVMVTNQGGIGEGHTTTEKVFQVNQRVTELVVAGGGPKLDAIYVCPHPVKAGCCCRKPRPGMLLQASASMGLDLHRSFMIGDMPADMLAGHAAGMSGNVLLISKATGNIQKHVPMDFVAENFEQAVEWILRKVAR